MARKKGLLNVKSNAELDAEKKAEVDPTAGLPKNEFQQNLFAYIMSRWAEALRNRRDIEKKMFENIRQTFNEYETEKLATIRQLAGSEVFVGLTDVKTSNAMAWIFDILMQAGNRPYGIDPSPVPDVPEELKQKVTQRFVSQSMTQITGAAAQQGLPLDVPSVMDQLRQYIPNLEDDIKADIRSEASRMADELEREVDDVLVEGGWYDALHKAVFNLVVVKAGFIKGPIKRYRYKRQYGKNALGETTVEIKRTVVKEFESRSPMFIYPAPDSEGVNDGYLFDVVSYSRKDLEALIGVEGFDEEAIRNVLNIHATGGFRTWTGIETERAKAQNRTTDSEYTSEKIDCLEWWGSVPGKLLKEWNAEKYGIRLADPDFEYDISCWIIGSYIIKAMLNEDPEGNKPYAKCSFEEIPGAFWGRALPEKITHTQTVVNACARALVNNVAMGSGPQVEINIDRLLGGEAGDTRLIPWRRWKTTSRMMDGKPAISFWQPQMHAQEILQVLSAFSKMADEHSGVPAYAHGDPQVGGAGNTASGLSMLIAQASRGIKQVIRNIDKNLIAPSIRNVFEEMYRDPKYQKLMCDLELVPRGSSALLEKEQRAVRMMEVLGVAGVNQNHMEVLGYGGLAYLWEEVAKAYEWDKRKLIQGNVGRANTPATPMQKMQQDQAALAAGAGAPGGVGPNGMGSNPPGAATLDQAGNAAQGMNAKLFTGSGGTPPAPQA